LLVAAVSGPSGPADLAVSIAGEPQRAGGGVVYQLTVRNKGGETAENVVIEAVIGSESREVTLLSVARGDEEQASVVFPEGATGPPQVQVLSYNSTTRG
jgi:hypothetical protein